MQDSAKPTDPIRATTAREGARAPTPILAAILAVATLAVYVSTVRNGFVDFDDRDYVTENSHVKSGITPRNIAWALRSTEAANWHPLTWISHMADVQCFGLNPAGHHVVSAILHAVNVVLLFLLLNRATGFPWRSFFVGGLFALHPLNVETVAWISERKSLLSMLFSLLAIACYGWYVRAPELKKYLAVVICFALALLSKPMAVTLPLVLLLLDYWPLRRLPIPFSGDSSARAEFWKPFLRLAVEKLPLFAMSLASSWITLVAQKRGGALSDSVALPLQLRLANTVVSYVNYIGKAFWPSNLSYYYPHPGNSLPAWQIGTAAVLLIAISVLVGRFRDRRHLLVGWGLFVVTLLPAIGIVQVGFQAMADRYAYIPFIGLFIIVVWELSDGAQRYRAPAIFPGAVASAIAIAFAVLTVVQIGYWHDSVSLFTHARLVVPVANTRIETNLAAALLDRGRTSEALGHFRIAESLGPQLFIPHFNIGYAMAQRGDNADALPELQAAVRLATTSEEKTRSLNSLAATYLDLGKNTEAAEAFSALLAIQPDSLAAHAGRGQALFNLAEYEAAATDFAMATKLRPAPELFLMAGKSLEGARKYPEAAAAYRDALKGSTPLAEARQRLEAIENEQRNPTRNSEKN